MLTENNQQEQQTQQVAAERINHFAYILKGIGYSVRLQIINALSDGRERAVNELRDELKVEQTVLSHHLAKMRELGLLTTQRDGKSSTTNSRMTKLPILSIACKSAT